METLTAFIASDAHTAGDELPGKTFTATPGFEALQTAGGALTHEFEIGGVRARRMVVPYQVWMLGRLSAALVECTRDAPGRTSVSDWLDRFERGPELLSLAERLSGCRVHREGSRVFSEAG
jgi:hypothetical protein